MLAKYSFKELFFFFFSFPTRKLKIAETSACDNETKDEEAAVLIQAITSIKFIIKEDPASHEKALLSTSFHL